MIDERQVGRLIDDEGFKAIMKDGQLEIFSKEGGGWGRNKISDGEAKKTY
jgi:hypothetical protein